MADRDSRFRLSPEGESLSHGEKQQSVAADSSSSRNGSSSRGGLLCRNA